MKIKMYASEKVIVASHKHFDAAVVCVERFLTNILWETVW